MNQPYLNQSGAFESSNGVFSQPAVSETEYFDETGTGSPFYSTNQPPAVYDPGTNTTYVTFEGPSIDPYAAQYDHTSGSWSSVAKVGTNPLIDDNHGAPTMAMGPEGHLHVFYGCHNDPIQYSRSSRPYDVTDWDDMGELEDIATYTKAVTVNGDIYVFYRRGDSQSDRPEVYIKSSDGGDTWTSNTAIIDWADDPQSMYTGDIHVEGDNIHLVWDHAPQPGLERYDVYHVYLNTSTGEVYTIDGTSFGSSINRSESETYAMVVDSGSDYAIVPRVRIDGSGDPHIIYNHRLGADSWEYRYTYWDGASWTTPTAITTTTSSDGPAFILNSASDITAFLSSTDGSADDIEEWHYDGSSWSKVQTILDHTTYGKNLNTPAVPFNYTDEAQVFFTEYVGDYSTSLKTFGYGGSGFLSARDFSAPGGGGGETTVVDDFESGGLDSSYTGSTADFSVQSTTVQGGSYALEAANPSAGDFVEIVSTSGLNAYPQPGDTYESYIYLTGDSDSARIRFGAQDNANYYSVAFGKDSGDDAIKIYLYQSDSNSTIAKTLTPYPLNEWLRVEISWGTDGSIDVLVEDSSSAEVGTVNANDTTYTSGGIGWALYNGGTASTTYFDEGVIL